MTVGYTTGVFDLFHVGHLNLLQGAKALCDRLIVGVATDKLTFQYKKKYPVIPFEERLRIVSSISYVDIAIRREIRDKYEEWRRFKFDVVFVGDDWYQDAMWERWEERLSGVGVKIIYLPYTLIQSSTQIINKIRETKRL